MGYIDKGKWVKIKNFDSCRAILGAFIHIQNSDLNFEQQYYYCWYINSYFIIDRSPVVANKVLLNNDLF